MSFTEDYLRVKQTLRYLNEADRKITLSARQRMAAHSIRAQLEMHSRELECEFGRRIPDQSDMDFALENDKGWDRGR